MPNGLLDPRGEMRETPRNKLLGLLADALTAANDYAQKPDPTMPMGKANPVLGLLADALPLSSLATTAQRASYGEPLTNGLRGSKAWLKPETADVAMMAPISPRNALAALGMGMADTGAAKAIFAGIGAKTADKAALAQAEKMTAAGADPRAIWRDTGWFKGGDGKWRFEIDDSAAKWIGGNDFGGIAGDALMHDALYSAHPSLRSLDTTAIVRGDVKPGGGLNYEAKIPYMDIAVRTPSEARSYALHELQHAVQESEGLAGGGNPVTLSKALLEKFEKSGGWSAWNSGDRSAALVSAKNAADALLPQNGGMFGAYQRLAGEAEARAVQSRMNLTTKQRRELFPLDSYDVPVNSLIYR